MEGRQTVRAITAGSDMASVLLIASASQKQARNGPFWLLELKDATGSIEARIWSPLSQQFADIATGQLASVEGRVESYRDKTQINVTRFNILSASEQAAMDLSDFIPSSRRPAVAMLEELRALCEARLTHAPWRRFALSVLDDPETSQRLLTAPAAKGVHHAWAGGLLEHTLGVCHVCMDFAARYPELDAQTLLVGALCHDIGKLWELSGGMDNEYTDAGRLVGHIVLAVQRLTPLLEAAGVEPSLVMHLQHLILSHHGKYEFGSPRLPQTAEALALHFADNVDAKLVQCRVLFEERLQGDGAWSPYQKTLERSLYNAPRTPYNANSADDERSDAEYATDEHEGILFVLDDPASEYMAEPLEMADADNPMAYATNSVNTDLAVENTFGVPFEDVPFDDIPGADAPESACTVGALDEPIVDPIPDVGLASESVQQVTPPDTSAHNNNSDDWVLWDEPADSLTIEDFDTDPLSETALQNKNITLETFADDTMTSSMPVPRRARQETVKEQKVEKIEVQQCSLL